MSKRFVYFSTKAKFLNATQGNEYDFTSIVFLGDSKEIWNRGIFYGTPEDFEINDYVTKAEAASTYQPLGDYLTEHQSLAEYVKTSEMLSKLANYYTKEEVDEAIEAIDVTDQLTEYAKKTEVTAEIEAKVKAGIDSIVDGASTAMDTLKEVEEALSESASTVEAINQAIGNKADKDSVYSKEEADVKFADYYNKKETDDKIDAVERKIPTLTDYAKIEYVDSELINFGKTIYTKEEVDEMLEWGEY